MKKTILPILLFALLTYCLPMVSLLLPAAGADDGANPFFGFGGGASSPSSAGAAQAVSSSDAARAIMVRIFMRVPPRSSFFPKTG